MTYPLKRDTQAVATKDDSEQAVSTSQEKSITAIVNGCFELKIPVPVKRDLASLKYTGITRMPARTR